MGRSAAVVPGPIKLKLTWGHGHRNVLDPDPSGPQALKLEYCGPREPQHYNSE